MFHHDRFDGLLAPGTNPSPPGLTGGYQTGNSGLDLPVGEGGNSLQPLVDPRFLAFALDKLVWYWHVEWPDDLFDLLDRDKCEALYRPGGFRLDVPAVEGGEIVATGFLQPRGVRRWPYVIATDYGFLKLSRYVPPRAGNVNVSVEASAEACWRLGVDGVQAYFLAWIRHFGGVAGSSFVGRVDWAADFLWPEGFTKTWLDERRVGRHRKTVNYDNARTAKTETYYAGEPGKSECCLRLYDKSLQLQRQPASFLWSVWGLPEGTQGVWRAEFQVRKNALRAYGVRTLEDLTDAQYEIWNALTSDVLSFREPRYAEDGKLLNAEDKRRWPYAAFWELVRTPRSDEDAKAYRERTVSYPEGYREKLRKFHRAAVELAATDAMRMDGDYEGLWDRMRDGIAARCGGEDGIVFGREMFLQEVAAETAERERRLQRAEQWRSEKRKRDYLEWNIGGDPEDAAPGDWPDDPFLYEA